MPDPWRRRRPWSVGAALGLALLVASAVSPVRAAAQSDYCYDVTGSNGRYTRAEQLHEQLRGWLAVHGVSKRSGYVVVRWDSADAHPTAAFVDVNLPDSTLNAVLGVISSALAASPIQRGDQVAVWLDDSPAPEITATNRECAPRLVGRLDVEDMMNRILDADYHASKGHWENTAVLELLVASDGSVPYARLKHSSGEPFIDGMMVPFGRRLHFRPATLNGTPVPAVMTFVPTFDDQSMGDVRPGDGSLAAGARRRAPVRAPGAGVRNAI
ncbi:MAG TPA: hypothetical protein VFL93_12300 [Longimicrobiaceae bacterium]|nr:hypothetical protein [Longimicrobiaceae bacterium]